MVSQINTAICLQLKPLSADNFLAKFSTPCFKAKSSYVSDGVTLVHLLHFSFGLAKFSTVFS